MKLNVLGNEERNQFTNVTFLFQDEENLNFFESHKLKIQVKNFYDEKIFEGKKEQIELIQEVYEDSIVKNIIVGLGKREELTKEEFRKILGKTLKFAKKRKIAKILLDKSMNSLCKYSDDYGRLVVETLIMADYTFDKFKTVKDYSGPEIEIYLEGIAQESLEEGRILGESTVIARELINEPANQMPPRELARRAKEIGKEADFEVEIFDEEEIRKFGMDAYLAVASGADTKPKLIVMRYFNDPDNKDEIFGLVGKGLNFDSGGLSLKPTKSMLDMKSDMSGAAAVIGAMRAISKAGLKTNVVAVIASCENMISGSSYRPGDILTTMGGKSVFVANTDAEGRLTLVDAVTYILEKENATSVVDIATLTGAAVVALGETTTAVVSNSDEFYCELEEASKVSDEKIWRLPIFPEYRELLKSKEADLTNSAGNPGTITAGLFIEAFVGEKPWLHLDIAGTSWAEKDLPYQGHGGTGVGVRTLYTLVKNKSN